MGRNRIKVYGDDTRKAGRQLMDLTCDGANDDVQLQRAIESLASGTVVIDCFGDFNIGATLDFDGNAANTKRYIFNHYGTLTTSGAIPVIRLGNTTVVRDSVFNLGYVYKSSTAMAAGSYGINAIRMVHSRVTFNQIIDFEKGIYVNAVGDGVIDNNWIGQLVNTCDVGVEIIGDGAPSGNNAENNTFMVKWLNNAYDKCLYVRANAPNTIFLGTDITTNKTKGVAPDPVVDAYCIYDDVGYNHFLCSMVIQDNDATHKFAGSAINNSFYASVLHNIYHYPANAEFDIANVSQNNAPTLTANGQIYAWEDADAGGVKGRLLVRINGTTYTILADS